MADETMGPEERAEGIILPDAEESVRRAIVREIRAAEQAAEARGLAEGKRAAFREAAAYWKGRAVHFRTCPTDNALTLGVAAGLYEDVEAWLRARAETTTEAKGDDR